MYPEKEYDLLISKLADIRNLFDESDMKAEGHGMEDMISDPYAVAVYTENKMKRLIDKVERYEKALKLIATPGTGRGYFEAKFALEEQN